MSEALIRLDAAGVRFGAVQALRACDLQINQGERVALLGANGSGKSTLLRLLHGQQLPSAGLRQVFGQRRQAMVYQHPHMLRLSVWRNLALPLWFSGLTWHTAKTRAQSELVQWGFEDLIQRNASGLSVGQRQRLALIRAWMLRPDILFLDEPTASLDPPARREMESLIAKIADMGCTIVFSTHNLGQAKRLATRVVYLELGAVVVDLPTDDFFNKDLPNEAAMFLQSERI